MENKTQKTIGIKIDETKKGIIGLLNNSELPVSILDMMISGIYNEVHTIAEKQLTDEYSAYNLELIKENADKEETDNE